MFGCLFVGPFLIVFGIPAMVRRLNRSHGPEE